MAQVLDIETIREGSKKLNGEHSVICINKKIINIIKEINSDNNAIIYDKRWI